MALGEFDKNEISERLNNIKRLSGKDERKLNDLIKTKEYINNLAESKINLGQLYDRVVENLDNADLELKKLALVGRFLLCMLCPEPSAVLNYKCKTF